MAVTASARDETVTPIIISGPTIPRAVIGSLLRGQRDDWASGSPPGSLTHVGLSEVDAISMDCQSNVDSVVYDERDSVLFAYCMERVSGSYKMAGIAMLVAILDNSNAWMKLFRTVV